MSAVRSALMYRLLLMGILWLTSLTAQAHKASDSYLTIALNGGAVAVRWDIALRDLEFALPGGLDADGNGEITWGELRARHEALAAFALRGLAIERGGACVLRSAALQVDEHTDGAYAVLGFNGECPAARGEVALRYGLLFEVDALHRGLLRLKLDGAEHAAVFSPTRPAQHFTTGEVSRWSQFSQYVIEGVWHIWIGFDHILFLLALLLPAVLRHEAGRWRGVVRFSEAMHEVLWVVTAFTVAHSITLSLAALGVVALPSRFVESAIAASVVVAALNNLKPVVEQRRWMAAFGFGLIHGFGFASVLAELGLPSGALALSLFGFNLGVEIGQLAIVGVFLPVAFLLRHGVFYRRVIFIGGSLATVALAAVWFAERALDLRILGA
jgi:hypothetical protein